MAQQMPFVVYSDDDDDVDDEAELNKGEVDDDDDGVEMDEADPHHDEAGALAMTIVMMFICDESDVYLVLILLQTTQK